MRTISHVTSIDDQKVTTQLKVPETYEELSQLLRSDYGARSDDEADAMGVQLAIDSLKLKRNAKVRGPVMKQVLANREATEAWYLASIKDDAAKWQEYVRALKAGTKNEFLDRLAPECPEYVDPMTKAGL